MQRVVHVPKKNEKGSMYSRYSCFVSTQCHDSFCFSSSLFLHFPTYTHIPHPTNCTHQKHRPLSHTRILTFPDLCTCSMPQVLTLGSRDIPRAFGFRLSGTSARPPRHWVLFVSGGRRSYTVCAPLDLWARGCFDATRTDHVTGNTPPPFSRDSTEGHPLCPSSHPVEAFISFV